MAHPWIFESNFEAGTNAEWDSEGDTGSLLDFPHYTTLARQGMAPYRGSYCMRWTTSTSGGDTNDHFVRENDIDIGEDVTRHTAFYMFFGNDFAFSADDVIQILEYTESAGGTVAANLALDMVTSTNVFRLGIVDGAGNPSSYSAALERNRWYHVSITYLVDANGSGTMQLFIDGTSEVSLTAQTAANPVTHADFGIINPLSTTTGTILFDEFRFDDARLFPYKDRFPRVMQVSKSGGIFVGAGNITSAALTTALGSNIMRLWDTDVANIDDTEGFTAELDQALFTSLTGPLFFKRGLYVELTGTTPQGQIEVISNVDIPGSVGPLYYSHRGMIYYGKKQKVWRNNI